MGNPELALNDIPKSEMVLGYREEKLLAVPEQVSVPTFGEIFEQYRNLIFQLLFRILGNYDDALEMSQEVFLTVFRKLHTFKGNSSIKTWLYRVTVNKALNHLRWWKARRKEGMFSLHYLEPARLAALNLALSFTIPTPEQTLLGNESAELFHRCLQKLPLKCRMVLVMRDMEGMSYEEIAESIGVSAGTVKSRIARARERLRDLIEAAS